MKDTGGPAFPQQDDATGSAGMTLRDYFAAHAPEPPAEWRGGDRRLLDVIVWRYWYADAMLKERNNGQV